MKHKLDLSPKNVSDADEVFAISYKNLAANTRRGSQTGSTKSTADFEKAIKETGYGKFNYLLILLSFPASCSTSYDMTSLSYALPTATCDLKLSAYDRGYLNGAIYIGLIASAPFWGFVSDKFGRQRTLVFGYLGNVFFGLCVTISQSFWSLLIFKILCGIMICGPSSIFMPYLSELFNAKHRDSVIMMVGLFQAIGSIFQPLIALAILPQNISWSLWDGRIHINSWRVFMLVCTLPSLVAGVGTAFCLESPRFLLAKGRKDEALRVFRSIYSTNTGKPASTYSVKKLKSEPQGREDSGKATFWHEITALFRPPHLHKALLVFAIQFGCLLTLNTMRLWLPQLFTFIKQSNERDSLDTCQILGTATATNTTNCANFKVDTSVYTDMLYASLITSVSFSVSTAIVAYTGKRNLLVTLFVLQSVAICGLGWVQPPLTMILAAIFVALSNTAGIGLLGFVVQIFPTSLRTMAMSLTMMVARIGVVLGNATLPFFLGVTCYGTFFGMGLITLLCGAVIFALAAAASKSETSKKTQPIGKT